MIPIIVSYLIFFVTISTHTPDLSTQIWMFISMILLHISSRNYYYNAAVKIAALHGYKMGLRAATQSFLDFFKTILDSTAYKNLEEECTRNMENFIKTLDK